MRTIPSAPLCGVHAPDDPLVAGHFRLASGSATVPGTSEVRGWADYADPSDDQGHEQSCVGRAWAGWIECMVRRFVDQTAIPAGAQIDAHSIWQRGRELFWGGTLDGGLYVYQGLQAAIDLGVLPAGRLVAVAYDQGSICQALSNTPVVAAHGVGPAWYDPAANGMLDPTLPPQPDIYGSHCTLFLERLSQNGVGYLLGQNSWGTSWGWHGLYIMDGQAAIDQALANSFYTAQFDAIPSAWSGWQKWLV